MGFGQLALLRFLLPVWLVQEVFLILGNQRVIGEQVLLLVLESHQNI